MYRDGTGVEQDYHKAMSFFYQSLQNGFVEAKQEYGINMFVCFRK